MCLFIHSFLYLLKEYYQPKKQQNYQQNEILQYHYKNKVKKYYHKNYGYNKNNINSSYFACFVGLGREGNKYVREFIEYYLKLGVEKFILGDNNLPNTAKLSDVLQDYINDGTVDIIELFGSAFGQSALNNLTYEKYNKRCKWMLFFDFDEFLEVHFEDKKVYH